eukprot:CAMPEP_0197518180 /NCGR_PEP_ID=MMETSP1318-20131121/3309_1 /TAXON_ID=552666 /ORGANISM="Partenskyella glossopodia, Strain RCC365" /LENGTH=166 /DNA_ID=CAMNT_0043068299 /DNA_START=150 /DNA_END=650 /DNA_ORIENTATION=+
MAEDNVTRCQYRVDGMCGVCPSCREDKMIEIAAGVLKSKGLSKDIRNMILDYTQADPDSSDSEQENFENFCYDDYVRVVRGDRYTEKRDMKTDFRCSAQDHWVKAGPAIIYVQERLLHAGDPDDYVEQAPKITVICKACDVASKELAEKWIRRLRRKIAKETKSPS